MGWVKKGGTNFASDLVDLVDLVDFTELSTRHWIFFVAGVPQNNSDDPFLCGGGGATLSLAT